MGLPYSYIRQKKKKCPFEMIKTHQHEKKKKRNESQQTPIHIEKKIHNSNVFRIFARKVNHTNKHLHQIRRKLSTQTKPSSNSIVLSQSQYGFSIIHANQQQIKQKGKKETFLEAIRSNSCIKTANITHPDQNQLQTPSIKIKNLIFLNVWRNIDSEREREGWVKGKRGYIGRKMESFPYQSI